MLIDVHRERVQDEVEIGLLLDCIRSLAARRADLTFKHALRAENPKVRGSNPLPATKQFKGLQFFSSPFFIDFGAIF